MLVERTSERWAVAIAVLFGTEMADQLDCSPLTKNIGVQSPAGSFSDFRKRESCRMMPLVGGFSRGPPFSPALAFRRCSILTSFDPHSERGGAVVTHWTRLQEEPDESLTKAMADFFPNPSPLPLPCATCNVSNDLAVDETEASLEPRRNARAGENGKSPRKPWPLVCIVRHDSHMRKYGYYPRLGIEPVSPRWEASCLTTTLPRPQYREENGTKTYRWEHTLAVCKSCTGPELFTIRCAPEYTLTSAQSDMRAVKLVTMDERVYNNVSREDRHRAVTLTYSAVCWQPEGALSGTRPSTSADDDATPRSIARDCTRTIAASPRLASLRQSSSPTTQSQSRYVHRCKLDRVLLALAVEKMPGAPVSDRLNEVLGKSNLNSMPTHDNPSYNGNEHCNFAKSFGESLYTERVLYDEEEDSPVFNMRPYSELPCGNGKSSFVAIAAYCCWSPDFLLGSPVSPPLHSGAAPYSPRFTLTGSQDLDFKSRTNLPAPLYTTTSLIGSTRYALNCID
ncbi:hypothetical protein PR048_025472 [Dryococelus australis]|uniref:Uncharacterized protein n=1 Tax=Dryococelus australis TaxID=614101 RepID=A0ABQ9GRD5_9NEOP|nr:hypothetical protein PR048_025472 [Dryococelus australis]